LSYSSKDKPAVTELAEKLRARGVDVWFDEWEVAGGDPVVSRLNDALDAAQTAVVVFSEHTPNSPWLQQELDYWIWARVHEHKVVVPVVLGTNAVIPPLIRKLARRAIEDIDAIVDAVVGRGPAKPDLGVRRTGLVYRVTIDLTTTPDGSLHRAVTVGE